MLSSPAMHTSELDYTLPESLIAQRPAARREDSRLLVLNRGDRSFQEDVFENVGAYLSAGDCLVLNDTRVVRARLIGHKPTGGKVELFLLRPLDPQNWEALVRPSSKVKPGTRIAIGESIFATAEELLEGGKRRVHFDTPDVLEVLERCGRVPLPPYIDRTGRDDEDASRYQTVYARAPGAVAAPTAGLHFSEALLERLSEAGVRRARLTLHVGYGTFRPVTAERIEDHVVDPEIFELDEKTVATLNETRASGGRIVAVGTTSTRVLETQYAEGEFHAGAGETDRYIYPPYDFKAVDALQTNFHLPRSSLLALVAAFAGTEFVLEAYRYAVREKFRFYSYGDVMLIT